MISIRTYNSRYLHDQNLDDQIIEFDKDAIYISSVQVAPSLRNTSLFTRLVVTAVEDLAGRSFNRLVTNVQKHNKTAIGLYLKLGFTIDEANASETSFPVHADPSMLDSKRLRKLKRT